MHMLVHAQIMNTHLCVDKNRGHICAALCPFQLLAAALLLAQSFPSL